MNEIKIHGLVTREAPMGDKDKRLSVLSAEYGRLSVIAKGALTAKSRFRATANQLCYAQFVLSRSGSFYYLKEATLLENFYDIRLNLDRLSYAALLVEAAETFCLDGEDNTDLLRLLLRSLYREAKAPAGQESLPADTGIFRMLCENGFYPDLTRCHQALYDDDPSLHSLQEGTITFLPARGVCYCQACLDAGKIPSPWGEKVSLSPGAVRAIRYILEQPEEKAFSFKVTKALQQELDRAAVSYLENQTERHFRSLDFLSSLSRQTENSAQKKDQNQS